MFFGRKKAQETPATKSAAPLSGAQGGSPAPSGELRRLRLRFVGEVQGVGFRWTAMNVARELGLTGWVLNEDDGSVSMELQGEPSHVGAFFSRMLDSYRWHPISYTVDQRDDIDPDPAEKDFQVRYLHGSW